MTSRMAARVTVLNLILLTTFLAARAAAAAESVPDVLRARAWELVDAHGRMRASMKLSPDGTVVLRLTDPNGTIRVKLAADERGSGLVLLNGATDVGAHITADGEGSTVVLANPDGRRQTIRP